jgi:hypothetical protein
VRFVGSLAYGAAVFFLVVRIIAIWGYSGSPHQSFIDSRALNIGLPLLGGTITALSFLRLSQFATLSKRSPGALFLRAGLYGILATALTFQVVFVAIALRVSWPTASTPSGASLALAFLLALIDVETYGLIVTAFCAPFAFIYGAVLALPLIFRKNDLGAAT